MKNDRIVLMIKNHYILIIAVFFLNSCKTHITTVGSGWSSNSVNTVKFRKNAVTTFKDYQFVAYYNQERYLVLAKRHINNSTWEVYTSSFKGNIKDAHNSISIAIDGDGYLHVSWDHHDTSLKYAVSIEPLGLKLGEIMPMTGFQEDRVTYPQFYNLPNGNLIFFYRSGKSGRGNLVINSYDIATKKWSQLQTNLIDGEEQRSAYWQACVDNAGTIHLSWVWRETWDVETNHDLCYARSNDSGLTWEKSSGEKYNLPITLESSEYAWKIPQKSNLINQTAMVADKKGNPYIVTYWEENNITQYQLVYLEKNIWKKVNTGFRTTTFNLGGGGTKSIPISRPDIILDDSGSTNKVAILLRDEERGNKVSLAYSDLKGQSSWKVKDLSKSSVGQWEPNYDVSLWKIRKVLDVFFQNVIQLDQEGVSEKEASKVKILSIKDLFKNLK